MFDLKEDWIWNPEIDNNSPEEILVNLYNISQFINYKFDKKTYKELRKKLKKIIKRKRKI